MVVHDAGNIAANFSGAITWLAGLGVREWGKLGIHVAVGLAIWASVISLVWYICWSLHNCHTEALHLLYVSYVLPLTAPFVAGCTCSCDRQGGFWVG